MAESRGHGREAIEALGQPPRTGRFWFDFLAASAAIFISVVSLVVAMRGEETQRSLLAANSWPFVQLSEDFSAQSVALDIENAGVGPAKIMTFQVMYHGHAVHGVKELLQLCCGLPPESDKTAAGLSSPVVPGLEIGTVPNNVLRPGEHILSLRLRSDAKPVELFPRLRQTVAELTYHACYCSVLDECWESGLRDLKQTRVAACAAPPGGSFEDNH